MMLSCRLLKNVDGVNSFDAATEVTFTEGDAASVYLQLVDEDTKLGRYMPAVGATLEVTLDNLDSAKRVVRAATQPFAQDPSIWKVDVLPTDKVAGTVTLRLKLTEGLKVTRGSKKAALLVRPAE